MLQGHPPAFPGLSCAAVRGIWFTGNPTPCKILPGNLELEVVAVCDFISHGPHVVGQDSQFPRDDPFQPSFFQELASGCFTRGFTRFDGAGRYLNPGDMHGVLQVREDQQVVILDDVADSFFSHARHCLRIPAEPAPARALALAPVRGIWGRSSAAPFRGKALGHAGSLRRCLLEI